MKNIGYKKMIKAFAFILLILFLGRPLIERGLSHIPTLNDDKYTIQVVDDSGFKVKLEKPATRIISLYSAHTENLFSLDLGDEIIGVGTSEAFPHEALEKPVFDYKADPEKVIAAQPDLVVIRPFIERNNPGFVNALRRAGITVVSLYPDNAGEFEAYIERLAILTGREKKAAQLLDDFYEDLAYLESLTKDIDPRVGVYFESSDREYKTITPESMAARAIEIAGGRNLATDVTPVQEGSSIAIFGLEEIINIGHEIDVFVTQRGVMGGGGNYHSISIRPGFDTIKAIKNKRVLEINQKIISSPTFRQVLGVVELMRFFYPDTFNDYSEFKVDQALRRRDFAKLTVNYMQKPLFIPTASYFRSDYRGHKFGYFEDIEEDDLDYYFIETAVLSGYISGYKVDLLEYFEPNQLVTKEEVAKFIFLVGDYKNLNKNLVINDLDQYQAYRTIEILVENGVFSLDEAGNFNGHETLTGNEIIDLLEKVRVTDD